MTKKDFEKFYNEHFDKVYRFVFFRSGSDKALAEDLVSEIFIKALKAFDSFDESRGRSAWIITIAKNHLANHWRDSKTTVPLPSENGAEDADSGLFKSDDKWLYTEGKKRNNAFFEQQELRELLVKLTEEEQEIVTFHYLFGYSYAEIASEKGVSEGSVKIMAHRAIKKMRDLV